jgi:hypothetical protein
MKKLNSNLFQKFKLKASDLRSIVGGAYTSASSDTSAAGGRYDICFETCVDGEGVTDSEITSPSGDTRDKPVLTLAP